MHAADESMLDTFRERQPSTTSQVSLDEQIDFLQEKLLMIQSHSGYARKRKEKSLRRELSALRRQMRNERKLSGVCVCACVHAYVCVHIIMQSLAYKTLLMNHTPLSLPCPQKQTSSRCVEAPHVDSGPPASPAMRRSWPRTSCMGVSE